MRHPNPEEMQAFAAVSGLPLGMLVGNWEAMSGESDALAVIAVRLSLIEDRLARVEPLLVTNQ